MKCPAAAAATAVVAAIMAAAAVAVTATMVAAAAVVGFVAAVVAAATDRGIESVMRLAIVAVATIEKYSGRASKEVRLFLFGGWRGRPFDFAGGCG